MTQTDIYKIHIKASLFSTISDLTTEFPLPNMKP